MSRQPSGRENNTGKKNKGETEQSQQKHAPSTSNKTKGKHEKDDSSGAEKNTTKKQQNSI